MLEFNTKSFEEELQFDQYGREIRRNHEENNPVDSHDNIEIIFGLLELEEIYINGLENWNMKDDEKGIFFIKSNEKDILNHTFELKDLQDNVIWQSDIMELPQNSLSLRGYENQNLYITSKVLYANEMPLGDNIYSMNIKELGDINALPVIDIRQNNQEDILDINDPICIYTGKQNPSEVDGIETSAIDRQDLKDDTESTDMYKAVEVDVKSLIIETGMKHMPVNIDCRQLDEVEKVQHLIVMEKIGNYYIAIQYGIMPGKPMYILNGDKQYFNFSGTPSEFVSKIENRICMMYGMDKKEFNEFKKLFIIDEKEDNINEFKDIENLKIITRESVLNNISDTEGKIIIDLGYKSCTFVFNDKDGNRIKVESEGLGLNKGEHILDIIKYVVEKLNNEDILYTGLFFVESDIYEKVNVIENTNSKVMLAKYLAL